MWHDNEREWPFAIRDGYVAPNIFSVSCFVGDVLNISQLVVFEIGLATTNFRDFALTNEIVTAGIARRRV